jgi:putative ABC transport system permease protein
MARARLLQIGERRVSAASFPEDERAQRLVEREFNLSWRQSLPPGNSLAAGRWFSTEELVQGVASVEAGLAKTLGIQLGDDLLFSVAGIEKKLRVVNLRKLDWESMRVNFFVLTPPGIMDEVATSYITSFHLPPGNSALNGQLLAQFPNITLIDVSAVLRQLETVMSQVSAAIQFIFLFTLVAGGVVLYSALFSAFDERRHTLALMRALGAQRRQLRQAMIVELAATGALAGLIAALGAELLGQLIARQVFQMALATNFTLFFGTALVGAALSTSTGWLALRALLATPPLQVLRNGL